MESPSSSSSESAKQVTMPESTSMPKLNTGRRERQEHRSEIYKEFSPFGFVKVCTCSASKCALGTSPLTPPALTILIFRQATCSERDTVMPWRIHLSVGCFLHRACSCLAWPTVPTNWTHEHWASANGWAVHMAYKHTAQASSAKRAACVVRPKLFSVRPTTKTNFHYSPFDI